MKNFLRREQTPMREYISIRASRTLDQDELVELLKTRFPKYTKPLGRQPAIQGTEMVETRVAAHSDASREICEFVQMKRKRGDQDYSKFVIASNLFKYTREDLLAAEALQLSLARYFEPCGEECGTIYETFCNYCNAGVQKSELTLNLGRAPNSSDMAITIAQCEWIVSAKFADMFRSEGLSGAELRPVIDTRHPTRPSRDWYQLWVTANAGALAPETELGWDAFSPGEIPWKCPRGHSLAASFLSEVYLQKCAWSGADISVTQSLFGQGKNLVRPRPLIIISQKLYRVMSKVGIKGYSCEVVRFV